MGEKVKSSLHKSQRYCCKFILASAFIFQQSSFLFQHGKKAMYTYIIQEFSPIRHFYSVSEQRNIYLIFQHLGRFKDRFNKNKQIQMTHALWCGNNGRCVLRVLRFGFSPPVHPPICRYVGTMSICIL